MVTNVLKILLLLSPICYLTGVHLQQFDIQFFQIGIMALFGASLVDSPVRQFPRENYIMAGLIGLLFINIGLHRMNPVVSINCLHFFMASVGLFIVVRYVNNPKSLYPYIVLPAVLNIIVFTLEKCGVHIIFQTIFVDDPGGLMGNAPRLMTYLGLILPFMLNYSIFWFLACIACAVVGTEITLLASAAIVLFLKVKNMYFRLAVVVGSGVGLYLFRESILTSLSSRMTTWVAVLTGFFKQPIAGYGLGIFPYKEFPVGVDPVNTTLTVFSSLLQFVTGIGILGALWLCFVLKKYKSHFTVTPASLSILSLTIFCIVEYPIEIHRIWLTIIAIVGIFIIESKQKEHRYE